MFFNKKSLHLLPALAAIFVAAIVFTGCETKNGAGMPEPVGEGRKEFLDSCKRAYIEMMHRAAPGTDWRSIERDNAQRAYYGQRNMAAARTTSSFAGGAINGTWAERGNNNLAGRMDYFAFLPSTSSLYAASDGGSIWKTTLPAVSWSKVGDFTQFNPYVLAIIPRTGGGQRLLTASGTTVWRTDNDGASFDTSSGIHFPVGWGGNTIQGIYPVNDASHTIYCVTFGWEPSSWTAEFGIYASVDSGVSFHFLRYFAYHNQDQLSFCSPLASSTLYALGVSSSANDTLYSVNNSVVSIASTTSAINTADNKVDMKCMVSGGITHFYALTGGTHIYHSTNMGNNWNLKSTVSSAYIIGVSSQHPENVSYGAVEAYRSTDSGTTWTLINTWGSYYGSVSNKLHADLRNFSSFQYSSGSEFRLVGTDGGAYISSDQLATVSNISMNGLRVNQLWDHITSPTDANIVFGGAQDQGLQTSNAASGTGLLVDSQVISGDYGQLRITGNGSTLWPEYPGGNLYLYKNLTNPAYLCTWSMTGTQLPNAGWMLPTGNYFTSSTQNEILIGGGNTSGDSGSYLIRLTLVSSGSDTVIPHQYAYNFRPNSRTGTAGISCIATTTLNTNQMYVGTEDGTFFYSTDAGTTWNKTASFSGVAGDWLYGATILPAIDSAEKVYFGGSGYSNPPVYVSRDHGVTFTAMSSGLPPTLVYRLASYANDSFLFAATEAGPFVYVKAANKWYSLSTAGVPAVNWRSVEYLPQSKTVRFGTYGRGIWDFNLTAKVNGVNPVAPTNVTISVGPNPVKPGQPITVFTDRAENFQFKLYSLNGQLMFDETIATNAPFSIGTLPAGFYVFNAFIQDKISSGSLIVN